MLIRKNIATRLLKQTGTTLSRLFPLFTILGLSSMLFYIAWEIKLSSLFHAQKERYEISLVDDKETLIKKLKNSRRPLLDSVQPKFQKDKDIVMISLDWGGEQLQYASTELKNDPEVIEKALGSSPRALAYAGSSYVQKREEIIELVRRDGLVLEFADTKFKSDQEVVKAAIINNPLALRFVSALFKDDAPLIELAINRDGRALRFASHRLRTDMDYALKALASHPDALEDLEDNFSGNPKLSELRETAKMLSKNKGLFYEFKLEVLQNINDVNRSAKPLALLVYPAADLSGVFHSDSILNAFSMHIPALPINKISEHYQVIYYEIGTDTEFFKKLQIGKLKKISLLVIGGHGSQKATSFGANFLPESIFGSYYLSQADEALAIRLNLKQYLASDAKIALISCSTGVGEEKAPDNVANSLHRIFPELEIFAPTLDFANYHFLFNTNGILENVFYGSTNAHGQHQEGTYHIKEGTTPVQTR